MRQQRGGRFRQEQVPDMPVSQSLSELGWRQRLISSLLKGRPSRSDKPEWFIRTISLEQGQKLAGFLRMQRLINVLRTHDRSVTDAFVGNDYCLQGCSFYQFVITNWLQSRVAAEEWIMVRVGR